MTLEYINKAHIGVPEWPFFVAHNIVVKYHGPSHAMVRIEGVPGWHSMEHSGLIKLAARMTELCPEAVAAEVAKMRND